MKFKNLTIFEGSTIRNALELFEKSGQKFLIARDTSKIVKGVITDGDIRRGFLKGLCLDDSVKTIMTTNFLFLKKEIVLKKLKKKHII